MKKYNQPQTELVEFAPETALCQLAAVSGGGEDIEGV